jgi:hypothetical protein
MTDRIRVSKALIEAIYLQSTPSEPIHLGQHAIQVACDGATYEDIATIAMRFMPRDQIEIACQWKGKPPLLGLDLFSSNSDGIKLTLVNKGVTFDVFCASFGTRDGPQCQDRCRHGQERKEGRELGTTLWDSNGRKSLGERRY